MQNLKFTRLAENDLLEVVEYIALDNPSYLVFYRQTEEGIEIIRLGEGHRDWASIVE